jgi:hypothetical protein
MDSLAEESTELGAASQQGKKPVFALTQKKKLFAITSNKAVAICTNILSCLCGLILTQRRTRSTSKVKSIPVFSYCDMIRIK